MVWYSDVSTFYYYKKQDIGIYYILQQQLNFDDDIKSLDINENNMMVEPPPGIVVSRPFPKGADTGSKPKGST